MLLRPTTLPLCCATLALGLAACGGEPDVASACHLPGDGTVLAIGDSITRGYGAAGNGYAEQLQALFRASPVRAGVRVLNQGVDGETSSELRARLPAALAAHAPAAVLITTGGNDLLRRVNESEIRANLDAIVGQVRSTGAWPVVFAIPKPSLAAAAGLGGDHALYAELGEATGAGIITDVVADVLAQEQLRSDTIHPNAAGYARLAEAAFAVLADCR
jgi:acyl-CoA hydrolase